MLLILVSYGVCNNYVIWGSCIEFQVCGLVQILECSKRLIFFVCMLVCVRASVCERERIMNQQMHKITVFTTKSLSLSGSCYTNFMPAEKWANLKTKIQIKIVEKNGNINLVCNKSNIFLLWVTNVFPCSFAVVINAAT